MSKRCQTSQWEVLQGTTPDLHVITFFKFVFRKQSLKMCEHHKWHRRKLIQRRRWQEKWNGGQCLQQLCNWKRKCDVSYILPMFAQSGPEQGSVCCAGVEGLRAFSEPNYAQEEPFFFFPWMHQSDRWQCLTSGSLLCTSLTPPAFSPLVHQSIQPASRSSKLDWH